MRTKRCKVCGCIIYDEWVGDLCDVCLDEQIKDEDKNFFNNEVQKTEQEAKNGT